MELATDIDTEASATWWGDTSATAVSEAIGELVSRDPARFADADSIVQLHRDLSRLEAFVTVATAAFDAAQGWEADGAQGAAPWLGKRCSLPNRVARRRVGLGRRLRNLPVCERAWLAGDITSDHVGAIAAVRRPETEVALARDEAMLVEHARNLRYEGFVKTVAYWDQIADPDGVEDDQQRRRDRRDVYLSESFQGMWLGQITLDPIGGTIVGGELRRIEAELFLADWAEARLVLGREPTVSDLARTPSQRRADALVEMATRSATSPSDGKRPAPLFSVLVGYETLFGRVCELAQGTVVTPGTLLAWLDQAYIERAVFKPGPRVEVSATARLFTGATRRGIELRDRCCTHEYCDRPADECQADHIVPFARGGPTTQDNGQLLCGFHNRLREKRSPPDP